MAKKTRRARKAATGVAMRDINGVRPSEEGTPRPASVRPAAPVAPANRITSMEAAQSSFKTDYSYVMGDLRRVGIMAVSFIGILIVLSFIIR